MFVATITSGICTYEDSVYLAVTTLTLDAGNDTILCAGVQYELQAETSLTNPSVSWTHSSNLTGATTLTPTTIQDIPQYYTVTVSEGICTDKDSVFIDYYQHNELITTNHVDICTSDTFSLNLVGGSNYVWDNTSLMEDETTANPKFFPSSLTLFIVDYEYGGGCQDSDSIEINVISPPEISMADTLIKCPENSVLLSPVYTNVDDINWSTTAQTASITVSLADTYYVEGSNSCRTILDSVVVVNFQVDQVDLGEDTSLCYYQNLAVMPQNVDPTTTFVWNNGNPTLNQTVTAPLTLSIVTTDTNFCVTRDTLVISQYLVQTFSLGNDITFCSYETAELEVNNPAMTTYVWNTGQNTQTIVVSSQGNYSVFALDSNSCAYVDTIFVDEIVAPFPIITGNLEYCPGATTSLGLSGSYATYHWSTGEATPTVNAGSPNQQIWVQVSDIFNCIGSDTVTISEIPMPELNLGEDYAICPEDVTQLNALVTGATAYQWNTGQNAPIVFVSPGTYDVQAIYNGCSLYDTITIFPKQTPVLELGEGFTICPDGEIIVTPDLIQHYDSLVWFDGTQAIPFRYDGNIIMFDSVFVTATAYGCGSASDTLAVYVENCECIVYIPNTFTPDGNDFNNDFRITHLCDFYTFELTIYDRWGNIIFQTNNPDFSWDARNPDGSPIQDGVYTWTMTYQSVEDIENHVTISQTGSITVLR